MKRVVWVPLFYVAWFTWFELCQGYGIQVLPEVFNMLYWFNLGILFFASISLAVNVRAGVALTLPVMILEDIVITTIHRAYEGGVLYALTHWNLENHPWYGAGAAWWLNTILGLKLTPLEGFMMVNVLAAVCFVAGFWRLLSRAVRLLRKKRPR